MANHKSALKRARQNEIRRERNKTGRTRVKNMVKSLRMTAAEKSSEELAAQMVETQAAIDKAAKKGIIHKKTAARKISRLTKMVNGVEA